MRRTLLASIASVIVSVSFAQAPDKAAMDTLLNRLTEANKLRGYVQLSKNGRVVYGRGFGEARPGVVNSASTIFRIGSISKVFTATMVMQQVEAGKLSLEDKLGKWFPQIPNAAEITIDQLLSHRSGIRSITSDTAFMSWQDTVKPGAETIRRMAGMEAEFAPGTKSEYSNSNYILLGYILEKVSGKSYAKLLEEKIASPLKLKNTAMGRRPLPAKSADAASFSYSGGKWSVDELSSTEVAAGAGGIVSTVPELATFITALMQGRLVSPGSLEKMQEIRDGYGRGLLRIPFGERQAYGHNGRIDNFSSSLGYFPKDSLVMSLVCNGVNYNPNLLVVGMLSLYYGAPYKMPEFSATVAVSAAQLKRTAGIYTNKQIGMDITITAGEGGITAQATGQPTIELQPVSQTMFENEMVGVKLDFPASTTSEAPSMTLMQGGATVIFDRKQ